MWVVFVFTAAVVVFVVAAVAAGRGDSLATVPPDRAPDPLPGGPLSADDVAAARFAVGLRGYRMDQVDAVLERLQAELVRRDERIGRLEAIVQGDPVRARAASVGAVDEAEHVEAPRRATTGSEEADPSPPPPASPGLTDPDDPGDPA
ncbi:MAG TPA: DivIVA domain-containing protein [Jiangellales bacterium]|nr:DivIVA domain-containing protein [Jiangellales bacterium]